MADKTDLVFLNNLTYAIDAPDKPYQERSKVQVCSYVPDKYTENLDMSNQAAVREAESHRRLAVAFGITPANGKEEMVTANLPAPNTPDAQNKHIGVSFGNYQSPKSDPDKKMITLSVPPAQSFNVLENVGTEDKPVWKDTGVQMYAKQVAEIRSKNAEDYKQNRKTPDISGIEAAADASQEREMGD